MSTSTKPTLLATAIMLASIGLATLPLQAGESKQRGPDRPNIVLIMLDDLGFSDVGSYGAEISTPHLDRLAHNGLRFTQFYNTSRCSPTRASLLTGLYHHQAGMGEMPEHRTANPGFKGRLLPERAVTIAQLLQDSGYGTYMIGKWHLGLESNEQPLDWGFDRFYGILDGAMSFFAPGNPLKYHHAAFGGRGHTRGLTLDRDSVGHDPDFYATNRFTDYAKLFLMQHFNEKPDAPFFLYLAHVAPHWPLQALPHDIEKYDGKYDVGWDHIREERYRRQLEMGLLEENNTNLSERLDDRYRREGRWPATRMPIPAWETLNRPMRQNLAKRMAVYAAMVDNVDQNTGRLLDYLEHHGQLDNTIIIFLSDNGGAISGGIRGFSLLGENPNDPSTFGTVDSFISYGLGWASASNTPFRMYKCYVHEGGIATPFIVHWPDGIRANRGSFVRTPSHLIDVMPTVLEAAGVEYPENRQGYTPLPMEGSSLMPLLTGTGNFDEDRWLFWEHTGNKAARHMNWKLVQIQLGEWELYDMDSDRTEENDLSGKHPEIVDRMKREYLDWAERAFVHPPMHE